MQSPSPAVAAIGLQDLARTLGVSAPEGADLEIRGLATVEEAGPHDLTFLANDKYAPRLKDSSAGAVLVAHDFEGEVPMHALRADNPRAAFAAALALFHPPRPRPTGIHPTAVVPETCTLGADVALGPYAVLGEHVRLGDRVVVRAHAVLADDVEVGEDSEIHSFVSLREGVRLGARVVVQDGSVIGADGFGFEPDAQGRLQKVPQVGTVVIGDDVEIQANACVDRSALGATRVGRGTKIDNLAQIAHGCTVGEDSVICGQVGLAGSTHVGNRVMLGGQAGFSGHTAVGDGARVAGQAGVMSDLEAGESYAGAPAIPMKNAMRSAALIPSLPEMLKRIRALEKQLKKLQAGADGEAHASG